MTSHKAGWFRPHDLCKVSIRWTLLLGTWLQFWMQWWWPHLSLSSLKASLKFLLPKTTLLVGLVSAKLVGNLVALSMHQCRFKFATYCRRVALCPNLAFQPNVITDSFRSTVFDLTAFWPPSFQLEEERQHTLCPLHTLSFYVECTRTLQCSKQLCVCYGYQTAGDALSKERLSKWIV